MKKIIILISDFETDRVVLEYLINLGKLDAELEAYTLFTDLLEDEGADAALVLIEYSFLNQRAGPFFVPRLRKRFPAAKIVGFSVGSMQSDGFYLAEADGFINKRFPVEPLITALKTFL